MTYTPVPLGGANTDVPAPAGRAERTPLTYEPYFCPEGEDPYSCNWKFHDVVLKDAEGNVLFEQRNVEAPAGWSERAVRIVTQKYFRGQVGTPERETSVQQIVKRVVGKIGEWVREQRYFLSEADVAAFLNDLAYVILHQYGTFNSPVWFNLGVEGVPQQASACFIQSVEDDIESIADLQHAETMVFRRGSGSGTNFSKLRSRKELLSGGGTPSGPVSFMSGLDAWGGVIKSGGTTRRAAKMCILNADHPDIEEYVSCKLLEEQKAHALIAAGYSANFDDEQGAYASIKYQNANHSVRVTNKFMAQVELALVTGEDTAWYLNAVTTGAVVGEVPIKKLWADICEAAWACGDPGLQFDDQHNQWHTCPSDGRLQATNPCQPLDAPVLTPGGIRTLGEVSVGDTIWSGSRWTVITHKWATGVKPVYRYHTRAGVFTGTEQHRVVSGGEKVEVRDAEYIDTCRCPLTAVENSLDPQDILDGLMLGDGTTIYANDGAQQYSVLNIGENDQCYFESEVAPFINPEPYDKKRHRVESCTLSALPHTYLRVVPQKFHQGDPKKVRGFLRGLYSANGSICGGRVTLKASSFDVIEAVQQMLSGIGIPSYYTVNRPKDVEFANGSYTCKQSYDLNITTGRGLFRDLIGFIHPDKNARLDVACDTPSRNWTKVSYEIVDIEARGEMPVFDITVDDPAHTYWSGGLLVSNCSEYTFLNDTSCNLASLNLIKFKKPGGVFDWDKFSRVVTLFITAQDAMVQKADYPTKKLTETTRKYNTLGLGFTNLGAYLMSNGLAYDSNAGREFASAVTSFMTAKAYRASARLASAVGPFEAYERNKASMRTVLEAHRKKAAQLGLDTGVWHEAIREGALYGFRNAQVTVIAPTGTISFKMDCTTTGCEPEMALYKEKHLVGGGVEVIENPLVPEALKEIGYAPHAVEAYVNYLREHKTFEGSTLDEDELAVFDCSMAAGKRSLSIDAHLEMAAAIQPFVSGAISKTINMPNSATVEDVGRAYLKAWKLGLKCVSLYRDGCKQSQPVQTTKKKVAEVAPTVAPTSGPVRRKLADHQMNMHRIRVKFGEVKGYILVTPFEDTGLPGELFIKLAKEGSTISGLVDGWAQAISFCLQYGVPLDTLVEKFSNTKFEPAGFSSDGDIRFATSIYDAVVRKLGAVFLDGKNSNGKTSEDIAKIAKAFSTAEHIAIDAPLCSYCGTLMHRTGASCHSCPSCGSSTGCG